MRKDTSTDTLYRLIKELNIPVTKASVKEELLQHPNHPSLLSISDALDNWRITNGAYKLESENLIDVDCPFIAHVNQSEFVLVKKINEEGVVISDSEQQDKKLDLKDFSNSFSGTVLLAEPDEDSGEKDYSKKRKTELMESMRVPFLAVISFVILLIAIANQRDILLNLTWEIVTLFALKLTGIGVSVLLLVHTLDADNPFVQKLCKSGKNLDCNAILSSKAAKVTEWLSWSEVGFFYFSGTILLLLTGEGSASLSTLAILNMVSLPYTLYSIFYQWQIAKKWCLLCCSVQAILWLEFLVLFPNVSQSLQVPSNSTLVTAIVSLTLPVLLWIFVKPYLVNLQRLPSIEDQLRRFKTNPKLFEAALTSQARYVLPDESFSIVLGNREPQHILTMVSNPYCGPCSGAHKEVDELLEATSNLQVRIVFLSNNNADNPQNEIVKHLMVLNNRNDEQTMKMALNDWYEQKRKDYKSWALKYPVKEDTAIAEVLINQQKWCELTNIEYTPTLFLNGYEIPKPYVLKDIKPFIRPI